MSPGHFHDHQPPLPLDEKDDVPQGLPPGYSSASQHPTYNSPALCGMGPQFTHQVQRSTVYGSTPFEHQQTHMGYQHHHTEIIGGEQSGQAIAAMQSMQGAPSFDPPSFRSAMDVGTQYPSASDFSQFSQAGWFAPQQAAGRPQTPMAQGPIAAALPYINRARASTSAHGRTNSAWTDEHTEVLRQGKRAGKSVPDIVKDLSRIDGVERTPNLVSKRWGRMREGCVKKHEMDSILHAVCPEMVRRVYDELSNLDIARTPDFGVQLAAAERRARDILRQHVARGVQEVVLKLFGNDVSFSE
ncbi:hypothetical protein QBC32DRAFT_407895 [Pseudoneurospora amorphoporcata]|uniref:Myb-like domain-containing protein n=1 Tax=Pseudoneurospora amorphoporcata TaxID=241081 RepID=A0AAN6SCQ7_9PEZI|nr:hypothetical protein QBC32DRAFT_407895 [Pseudoneurospora amorphoporcata]